MKKITTAIMAIAMLLTCTTSNAQIKNAKTETVNVYGNCGMCKTTIEKAGNKKGQAKVIWNKDTKLATLTYDATKTNKADILKRIAFVGYDNDSFLAPDAVYNNLQGCCQYDRLNKGTVSIETTDKAITINALTQNETPSQAIYINYFSLKDALVKTDPSAAALQAKVLLNTINNINIGKMKAEEKAAFTRQEKALKANTTAISTGKDITLQRAAFSNLSANVIALLKVTKATEAVYIQHCPMYNNGNGTNWLSKENAVKNPYYGNSMLTCGKTIETIN